MIQLLAWILRRLWWDVVGILAIVLGDVWRVWQALIWQAAWPDSRQLLGVQVLLEGAGQAVGKLRRRAEFLVLLLLLLIEQAREMPQVVKPKRSLAQTSVEVTVAGNGLLY